MDRYPLNLILAVATASAMVFLGFLPTKSIRTAFFAKETFTAAASWLAVAFLSPYSIIHFPIIIALICLAASWHFHSDRVLSGKMWLNLASGLGISIGVMLILAVTPRGYPPGLPQLHEILLLVSIYLGGGLIGLAYFCLLLTESASGRSGVTNALVQRHVGLLPWLTLARMVVLFILAAGTSRIQGPSKPYDNTLSETMNALYLGIIPRHVLFLIGLTFVLLIFACLAQRATRLDSRILPTRYLRALLIIGFITEFLARAFVL